MLPKFCLDDNVRSGIRSPRGSSVLGKMKIAKRTREAKLLGGGPRRCRPGEWKNGSLGARRCCEVPTHRKVARHVSAEEPRLRVLRNWMPTMDAASCPMVCDL
jgi:hypothetical protein